MTTTSLENIVVNGECIPETLQAVCANLPAEGGEVLLDFFLAQTLDPPAIEALEHLAAAAEAMKVKVILRGVNVEMYKVLKLSGFADKLLFIN